MAFRVIAISHPDYFYGHTLNEVDTVIVIERPGRDVVFVNLAR